MIVNFKQPVIIMGVHVFISEKVKHEFQVHLYQLQV